MAASYRASVLLLTCSVAASALSGCHVTTNKHGKDDNVDIGTPFGSMSVKTNDDTVSASLGISPYPGAVVVKKTGDDSGSADVNMSFGDFHLGVVARSYQTGDKADKVTSFYRKDLARYGDVIACEGHNAVGTPTRTSQGLTCADSDKRHIKVSGKTDGLELRSGSNLHQRIVAVEDKDGGTRISLVKIDLPGGVGHSHDDKESE